MPLADLQEAASFLGKMEGQNPTVLGIIKMKDAFGSVNL